MAKPLSILCVHDIGHGDIDSDLQGSWSKAICAGLVAWNPALDGAITCDFLKYNSLFEQVRHNAYPQNHTKCLPVKSSERMLAAYNQVQLDNNIVTGYLSSLVKVTDTQNELQSKAGLNDARDKLSAGMINLSDDMYKALTAAPDKCHTVAGVLQAVSEFTKKVPPPATDSCN